MSTYRISPALQQQLQSSYQSFLIRYEEKAMDQTWTKIGEQFRTFWTDRIMNGGQREITPADAEPIIRFIDIKGRGNTKGSQAVGQTHVAQGAWERLFNILRTTPE